MLNFNNIKRVTGVFGVIVALCCCVPNVAANNVEKIKILDEQLQKSDALKKMKAELQKEVGGEVDFVADDEQSEERPVINSGSRKALRVLLLATFITGGVAWYLAGKFEEQRRAAEEEAEARRRFFAGGAGRSSIPVVPIEAQKRCAALVSLGFTPVEHPSVAEIKKRHRALVFKAHPDKGGSLIVTQALNAARDTLLPNKQDGDTD